MTANGCSLCELKVRDGVRYEDERFVCLPCSVCGSPLWVLKSHEELFSTEDKSFIQTVTDALYGANRIRWKP